MKKLITLLITALLTLNVFSQITAPQTMSYQAVVRNSSNTLIKNSPVGVKISILDGSVSGAAVYVETHSAQTNENGLLDLQIGGGQVVSGTYNNEINWGQPHFLKTEIDLLGGKNYTITSTSELLSVPVSNYAHISGALNGPSWDFVGAYTPINQANSDFDIIGISYMTYLGVDKVMWTYTTYSEGIINGVVSGKTPTLTTLYGTVFSNVVTFKVQDEENIIGTLIDKKLTIAYGSPPEGVALELVKE